MIRAKEPWLAALDSLEPDLKTLLAGATGDRINILALVRKEAENKKTMCLQKRLRVHIGGKQVVLRDVFDKIIAWVDEFKTIVDTAVSFDPVHAALPWAGVRFLLHVAVNDTHHFEHTIVGIEKITHLLARYAAFEELYSLSRSIINDELQDRLTSLYTQVLIFLAKGIKYFSQPSLSRILKSAFQSSQETELKAITELDDELQKVARLVDAQTQQRIQLDISTMTLLMSTLTRTTPEIRLVDAATVYPKPLEELKFLELVGWLSSVPYSQHHGRRSKQILPGSAQWIFQHPQYISWKAESSASILLVHGVQGCGKSTICSAVVEAFLADKQKTLLAAPLAYFYCADSGIGTKRASANEVLSSLTRQLAITDRLKHEIHELVLLEYQRRASEARLDGFEVPGLSNEECTNMILQVLGDNPAVIIVDGIDEIDSSQRVELLDAILRIRDESASVVKILLSTRDDRSALARLPGAFTLRIEQSDNEEDVGIFVRDRIAKAIRNKSLLNGNVPNELQNELVDFLQQRAGEMFLWVELQLRGLCQLKSTQGVQEAMRDRSKVTSQTITAIYSDLLQHMAQADELAFDIAMKSFAWLMCANEPLRSTEFLAAITCSLAATRTGDLILAAEDLESICDSLIILDKKLDIFRFAHSSFKEFLELKPQFSTTYVNQLAALSCVAACTNNPVNDPTRLRPDQDFDLYSALYWPRHYTAAASGDAQNGALSVKLLEFLFYDEEPSLPFLAWLETMQTISDLLPNTHALKKHTRAVNSESSTPVFIACIHGIDIVLQTISRFPDFAVDQVNTLGHTPLYLAASCGHATTVTLLLDLGANPTLQCGRHGDSLTAAAFEGHLNVVKLLLGSDIILWSPGSFASALRASIRSGHENISQLLLENGIAVSSQEQYDNIVLKASQVGFVEFLRNLQSKFPSYSCSTATHDKLIRMAITKGQAAFLTKYINQGRLPCDSIAITAIYGHVQVAVMCLDHGLDIEKEGPLGTPLRAASLLGHEAMVRLLIRRGSDINSNGTMGNALQAAAMNGNVCIIRLLIDNKCDVNVCGGYYGTALQAAAYRGHKDAVETLLDGGAQIDIGGLFKDAFHAAVEGAKPEDIVNIFLEKGCRYSAEYTGRIEFRRICYESGPGWSLLREASPSMSHRPKSRGGPRLKSSVSSTYDETAPDVRTASLDDTLRIARCEHSSMSRELDTHHATEPNDFPATIQFIKADNYNRSLVSAERRASLAHGILFRQNSPPGPLTIEHTHPALKLLAAKGQASLVHKLLVAREQLGIRDKHIGEALWSAVSGGYFEIVKDVLAVDSDIEAYMTAAICRAAWSGHVAVLECLLKHVDAEARIAHSTTTRLQSYMPVPGKTVFASGPHPLREFDSLYSDSHAAATILYGCLGGQLKVVKKGMELLNGKDTAKIRQIALEEAAAVDCVDVIEFLISQHPDMDPDLLLGAVGQAARCGSQAALLSLINHIGKRYTTGFYDEAFCWAVSKNRLNIVDHFIRMGPTTYSQKAIEGLFVTTACRGRHEMLRLLEPLLRGQEKCQQSLDQALNIACERGHIHVAKEAIKFGADVNAVVERSADEDADDDDGNYVRHRKELTAPDRLQWPRTALQACLQGIPATSHGHLEAQLFRADIRELAAKQERLISMLIDEGADVNLLPAQGCRRPPLCSAAADCSEEIVRLLITRGALVDVEVDDYHTPLRYAASRESTSLPIVKVLIAAGAQIPFMTHEGRTSSPILSAALNFFQDENGQFIESESLEDVLNTGPGAVVKLMLEWQDDLQADDPRFDLIMQMAVAVGDIHFVRMLISRGADVNAVGHHYGTALQTAARFGEMVCAQALLKAGADPNIFCGIHGTALQAAVKSGHAGMVGLLLAEGAEVDLHLNSTQSYCGDQEDARARKKSALHLAVEHSHSELARLLLNMGAIVPGDTSFWRSAMNAGDIEFFEALVDATGGIEAIYSKCLENEEENHILIQAAGDGNMPVLELLLSRGSNVNIDGTKHEWESNNYFSTRASALHHACFKGNFDIVSTLLAWGAEINKRVQGSLTPLAVAATSGHLEIMALLLGSGATIYDPISIPNALAVACQEAQSTAAVEMLLEALKDSPCFVAASEEALDSAVRNEHELNFLTVMRYLTPSDGTLRKACMLGSIQAVTWLLCQGVEVDRDYPDGGRALHIAAYYGKSNVVSLLIHHGVDCTHVSEKFGSPLHAALEGRLARLRPNDVELLQILPEAIFESSFHVSNDPNAGAAEEIVRILISQGAKADKMARGFGTPVHLASYFGDIELIQLLLKHGASLECTGGWAVSPLMAAVYGDQLETVKYLLDGGADVNISSERFGTALHHACKHSHGRMIQLLVEANADLNAVDMNSQSPLTALLSSQARDPDAARLVTYLLDQGSSLRVGTQDLRLAAVLSTNYLGLGVLSRLLDHDKTTIITQSLVEEVVSIPIFAGDLPLGNSRKLKLLLERASDVRVTKDMLRSVQDSNSLRLLLNHVPRCVATSDLFEVYATESQDTFELVRELLAREPDVKPTARAVQMCIEKRQPWRGGRPHSVWQPGHVPAQLLAQLLRRNPDVSTNAEMVCGASDAKGLSVLLEHAGAGVRVTEAMLKNAVSNETDGAEMLGLLLAFEPAAEIKPTVLAACSIRNLPKCLKLMLQRDPEIDIPEQVICECLRNEYRRRPSLGYRPWDTKTESEMADVLESAGRQIVFTSRIREIIEVELHGELKERWLRLERL